MSPLDFIPAVVGVYMSPYLVPFWPVATPTPLRTPVYMTRSKMNIHMFYDGRVVQQ